MALQFVAEEFADFAQSWGFEHVTSSPHYPQANGEVEHAVQTIKNLMKKSNDDRVPWSSNVPQHPTAQWVSSCSAQYGKNAEDQSSMSPGQTLAESTRRDHREEEREGLQGENKGEL